MSAFEDSESLTVGVAQIALFGSTAAEPLKK